MKYLLIISLLISATASAQTYIVRADTFKVQKVGGNGELILENATRGTTGVLVNYGNGRTRFSKPRINGDTLFVGVDTILGVGTANIYNSDGTFTGSRTATNNNVFKFRTIGIGDEWMSVYKSSEASTDSAWVRVARVAQPVAELRSKVGDDLMIVRVGIGAAELEALDFVTLQNSLFEVEPGTIRSNAHDSVVIRTGSFYTTAVTVDSLQRVGIGVTLPSATLDLVGTFQYTDGNQQNGYVLTSDASGNATWGPPGGSTAGIDDVLAVGQALTGNRAIDLNTRTLTIEGTGSNTFSVAPATISANMNGSGFDHTLIFGGGQILLSKTPDVGGISASMELTTNARLNAQNTSGPESEVTVFPDSITFDSHAGRFSIPNTETSTDTTLNKPTVWNTSTKRWSVLDRWPSGGGGSPAGNFGNIQINRNGLFATPGSDSLDWESATALGFNYNGRHITTSGGMTLSSSGGTGLSEWHMSNGGWDINANGVYSLAGGNSISNIQASGLFVASSASSPGYTASTSTLEGGGSFATRLASTATSITLDATVTTQIVTATGQTITLPTAVGKTSRIYTVKLTASGSCTVATTSSQTIDGSTTYSLASQYKYVTVQSDGANWHVIANN